MVAYSGAGAPLGGVISTLEAGNFIPDMWLTDLLRYRRSNLEMARFLKIMPFMGRKGDKIRFPRTGRLGSRLKTAGSPVNYQTRSEEEWFMEITRYVESSFAIDDIVRIQSHIDSRAVYSGEAARALAEDIDNYALAQRASIVGFDSTNSHIETAARLTYADILAGWQILNERKVPKENRVFIIGPAHEAAMFNINQFIQSGTYNAGNTAMINRGQIMGTIFGMPVVMSTNLVENSLTGYTNGDGATPEPTPGMTGSPYFPAQFGDSVDVYTPTGLTAGRYSAIMMHRDCIAMGMQKSPGLSAYFNIDYQEWRVVYTQLYDMKLLRPDHGVVISTDEDA